MTTRFTGGVLPAPGPVDDLDRELQALWAKTGPEIVTLGEGFQFHTALERTMAFLTATNSYIDKRAPWKLGKSTEPADQALLRTTLATIAEAARLAVTAMQHVTPASTAKIHAALGYTPGGDWRAELQWGTKLVGAKVAESLVLFPRPEKPAAVKKPSALK
jgi:methionyl-tRNA synthetase